MHAARASYFKNIFPLLTLCFLISISESILTSQKSLLTPQESLRTTSANLLMTSPSVLSAATNLV